MSVGPRARWLAALAFCGLALLAAPVAASRAPGGFTARLLAAAPTPTPSVSPTPFCNTTGNNIAAVQVTPICPQITLTPAVGPPGTVVTAVGTQYPRSYPVDIAWDHGTMAPSISPLTTDAQGGFTVRLLIFPNDPLGPRSLQTTATPSSRETIFLNSATFLVIPGSAQPSDFDWRR